MLQLKDWFMLFATLSSILVGILFPTAGVPFQSLPMYCMMALLFFSFLSIRLGDMLVSVKHAMPALGWYIVEKMVLLPLLVYFIFQYIAPKYALSALLLSGVSSGVASPFFAILVSANLPVVLGILIVSSVLVPFTLPSLAHILVGRDLQISLIAMSRLLCMVIFIPLFFAEIIKRFRPILADRLSGIQYPVSITCFVITNLGIFSKYSTFLNEEPGTIFSALGVAFILAGFYFLAGMIFSGGQSVSDRLALIVSFGNINNVLVLVFSSQFFGPLEPTVAAVYSVPFFALIVPLRIYKSLAEKFCAQD